MTKVLIKSLIAAMVAGIIALVLRSFLGTTAFIADASSIGDFISVFGTLFGILLAFVVFEVWSQYNKTSQLIDQEAQGLERLFRLTLYFRDSKLTNAMKQAVLNYSDEVITDKFCNLAQGQHNVKAGQIFRKIADVIKEIKFDDDHDQIVFDHIIDHYGHLSEIRTERINQSITRLPLLLKTFLYVSSAFALITVITVPFTGTYYSFMTASALTFILTMVFQLIEDLDNPFCGYWNLTTEPFERALKHIEKDY